MTVVQSDPSNMDHYGLIDWDRDGDFTDPGEDVSGDILAATSGPGFQARWGRDQPRAFSPPITPDAACDLNNESGTYSNLFTGSALYGYVQKGAPAIFELEHGYDIPFNDPDVPFNDTHTLFNGKSRQRLFTGMVWDIPEEGGMGSYVARVKMLSSNGLLLTEGSVTTQQVYTNKRTDEIITLILDEIGWPMGARKIGIGLTTILYWWAEGKNALQAVMEMLVSEGASAVCYIDAYGNFVFRPRDWRSTNPRSIVSQAIFSDTVFGIDPTFASTAVPMNDINTLFNGLPDVSLYYVGEPVVRANPDDVVNDASAFVNTRALQTLAPIWSWGQTISLGANQSADFWPSASDPFMNAQVPVSGTDYTTSNALASVTLQSLTGQQAKLTLTATASGATVNGLQLRAQLLSVVGSSNIKTTLSVPTLAESKLRHGPHPYAIPIWPELNPNQAQDLVNGFVLQYLRIRPQFTIAVVADSRDHQNAVFRLDVDDRVTIINQRRAIATDVIIERIEHRSLSKTVHMAILGCEQAFQSSIARWNNTNTRWDGALARWGF